jgi:Ca2+-binding RTX toxin-like protein
VSLNQHGNVQVDDNWFAGGSFDYLASDGEHTGSAHVSVTYDGGSTMNGTSANEIFVGNDCGTTINAGGGNDILIGNGGNDILNGGSGNDTYGFGLTDGHDTIHDTSGNDTIVIDTAGAALDCFSFTHGAGDDLTIEANGLQVTVADQYCGTNAVESVSFVGGENGGSFAGYSLAGTYNLTNASNGTSGNDIIVGSCAPTNLCGGGGNDLIFAGSGGGTVNGGTGNDLLVGGAGHDTFVFSANFGHDTIAGFQAGCDAVQFDAGLFSCVADILSHIANDCQGNAVLTLDPNNSVTFHDVTKETLEAHQSNFHLIA